MGRPRKVVAAPPAPPAAEQSAPTNVDIFFDDGSDPDAAEVDATEEAPLLSAPTPTPQVDVAAVSKEIPAPLLSSASAATPQVDLTAFLQEMQLMRETMVSQRTQIDALKESLFQKQQNELNLTRQRLAEQMAAQERVVALQAELHHFQQQIVSHTAPPPVSTPPPPPFNHVARSQPVFRNTPPELPRQVQVQFAAPDSPTSTHARLGLTGDLPNMTKKRQGHVAELQTGSRYVVRGSNGLT